MTAIATGSVIAFAGVPDVLSKMARLGWLKCDGASISRNNYPELFTVIGTNYGGDGNPNFCVPDMRGMFQRGVDEGTGRDPDRDGRLRQGNNGQIGGVVGSWQDDQFGRHHHDWSHFFRVISWHGGDIAVHQPHDSPNLQNHHDWATNIDGGGNETRPMNVYVYYLINSGVRQLVAVGQLNDGTILGIDTGLSIMTRSDMASTWVSNPNTMWIKSITHLRDSTIVGVGTDNMMYRRATLADSTPWTQVPNSGPVIAITTLADGRILGVGSDQMLRTRDSLTSSWVLIPNSGSVISIMQLRDGRIVGVGTDNFLWVRATLTSGWTQVPNSAAVTAVAQLKSGLILGVGTDRLLYQRGALDGPWVRAP